jgi:hypothetical protein
MGIKFSFSVPLKSIKEYAKKAIGLPPLPEYINKRGPYIHDGAKIMVVYEFDKAKIGETREIISKHVEAFQGIPGFSLHSQILEEGEGLKGSRINPENQGVAKHFTHNSQTLESI